MTISRSTRHDVRWLRAIGELAWAIELNVMFKRWCDLRDLVPDPIYRPHWIKMCMRLGDESAIRIISSDAEPILVEV